MDYGFDISGIKGLTEAEAAARLQMFGYNELPSSRGRSVFAIAGEVVREPMFLFLIAAGAIYLMLGDWREALILLSFVFVVMGITLYQERKTERALEALRDLTSPRAVVIRDGLQKRVPGREVVRGDCIILSEGDRVPADSVVLSCVSLMIDESLLSGESIPVRKSPCRAAAEMERPGGDNLPFVYSGTMVVQGFGVAEVKAAGSDSEIGRIGKALHSITNEETALQKETGRMVRRLAIFGILFCVLVVIIYGVTRESWLRGLLAGISLAMALLPEELPVVLTIFLALGAWRISHKRVLTRRVPAVEMLGSASVLCVDKTGTLTLNKMAVRKVFCGGSLHPVGEAEKSLPEELHEIVEFAMLASQTNPFEPMERALNDIGSQTLRDTEHLHRNWLLVQEYPLSNKMLAMSRVWKSPDSKDYIIAAKGAPEAIADICHLDEREILDLSININAMAEEGLRVIGVAKSEFREQALPGVQHAFSFSFLGLIGFADPVRPEAAAAIRECNGAGIRVVMITGDYPVTARNIASQIGLNAAGELITGAELDMMDDKTLGSRINGVNIFARVFPEQKLRIVNALKANGEVVAMTGDGVNDAAALKAAHIGIAMGGRGTDVARESSALVLLDDDFSSIVQAIRLGRRIFDNLRKAMAYTFAIHIPIAGMSLLPVVLNRPLVLLPVHIVFMELIIDPACSIVFEAENEEPGIMQRSPRSLQEPLFDKRMITLSLLQGAGVLLAVFAVYIIALHNGLSEREARTLSFSTLILSNLGLIIINRSWSRTALATLRTHNAPFFWVTGGALFLLGTVLYVPFFSGLFHFSITKGSDLAICLAAGIAGVLWFEIFKKYNKKRKGRY